MRFHRLHALGNLLTHWSTQSSAKTYDVCYSNGTLIPKSNGTRIFHKSHACGAPHKLISSAVAFNCHREVVQTSTENQQLRSKTFTDKHQAHETSETKGKRRKHVMTRGGRGSREEGGAVCGGTRRMRRVQTSLQYNRRQTQKEHSIGMHVEPPHELASSATAFSSEQFLPHLPPA
jgi:hypothetical protein